MINGSEMKALTKEKKEEIPYLYSALMPSTSHCMEQI